MSVWITLVAVGAVTFLLRASFIVFVDPRKFPDAFRRGLAYVPPAVLAAIVLPGLVLRDGSLDLTLHNPRWIAGLVAIAVAARIRGTLAPIAAGMCTLWLLQLAIR